MAKWIKAIWTYTDPSGRVSLQNFKQYKEEINTLPNGRQEFYRSAKPKDVTIIVCSSGKELHDESGITLNVGEFLVTNIPENIAELKKMINKGHIRLEDWDLHYQLAGEDKPNQFNETIVEEEMVKLEITPKNSNATKEDKKKASELRVQKAMETKRENKRLRELKKQEQMKNSEDVE